jgi:hypothetical protein
MYGGFFMADDLNEEPQFWEWAIQKIREREQQQQEELRIEIPIPLTPPVMEKNEKSDFEIDYEIYEY